MSTISMFYGIIIDMSFFDNKKHHKPHIYAEHKTALSIDDGELLDSNS